MVETEQNIQLFIPPFFFVFRSLAQVFFLHFFLSFYLFPFSFLFRVFVLSWFLVFVFFSLRICLVSHNFFPPCTCSLFPALPVIFFFILFFFTFFLNVSPFFSFFLLHSSDFKRIFSYSLLLFYFITFHFTIYTINTTIYTSLLYIFL